MRSYTIRQLLDANWKVEVEPECRIYIFRDGRQVFYVGQAVTPLHRTKQHVLDTGSWFKSSLRDFIAAKQPDSLDWQVEFLTLQDCDRTVKRQMRGPWWTRHWAVDVAERLCIADLAPRFNVAGNPEPKPLPHKYQWLTDDEKRRIRDQVSY